MNLDLAAGHRQRRLERAPCRSPPGTIAVKAEHDPIGHTGQSADVLGRRRRAERGHDGLDAMLGETCDVEVALDHENSFRAALRLASLVKSVERLALVKHGCLW